jgi:hypothetical protein
LALYLFTRQSTVINPATGAPVTTSAGGTPTTYGIGVPGVGPHAETVANYAALVAANPNLANPNYQLTAAEAQQYAANYLDISQGVATWPGGLSQANLQKHWTLFGAPYQRIFIPLVPPSGAPYIPVQQNPNSSGGGGSSWVSSALSIAGTILPAILGNDPKLNNAEVQMLMTGACIIKDILPMYRQRNGPAVDQIGARLTDLLTQYV